MNTRCPAWCDRVLMSPSAKELILRVSVGAVRARARAGGEPRARVRALLPALMSPDPVLGAGMEPDLQCLSGFKIGINCRQCFRNRLVYCVLGVGGGGQ